MKLGYSNFLQQYVPADQVDYGDCKTFQIVCPNCREAVFKVNRSAAGIEYLAHYRASKEQVERCELRVAAISRRDIEGQNALAQGQHLRLFHSVLRNALLARAESANWNGESMVRTITDMVKRPTYRELIRWARTQAKSGEIDHIWQQHEEEYRSKSPYYVETQLKYAKDMYDYVMAPNSFALYSFAISLAVVVSMGLLTKTEQKDNLIFHNVIGALIGGSDRDLKRVEQRSQEHHLMVLSTMLAASQSMHSWLVTLPYVDIIKQHTAS